MKSRNPYFYRRLFILLLTSLLLLGVLPVVQGCGDDHSSSGGYRVSPNETKEEECPDGFDAEEDGHNTGYEEGRNHEYDYDEYSPSIPDVSAEDYGVPEGCQSDWETSYESGYEQGLEDEAEENRIE